MDTKKLEIRKIGGSLDGELITIKLPERYTKLLHRKCDSEYNELFLLTRKRYLQDLMEVRKDFISLNEVLTMFELESVLIAGNLIGWKSSRGYTIDDILKYDKLQPDFRTILITFTPKDTII